MLESSNKNNCFENKINHIQERIKELDEKKRYLNGLTIFATFLVLSYGFTWIKKPEPSLIFQTIIGASLLAGFVNSLCKNKKEVELLKKRSRQLNNRQKGYYIKNVDLNSPKVLKKQAKNY